MKGLLHVCQHPQPETALTRQLLTKPPRTEDTHSVLYSGIFPCYLCYTSDDEVSSSRRSRDSCLERWMLDLDSRQEIKTSDGLVLFLKVSSIPG